MEIGKKTLIWTTSGEIFEGVVLADGNETCGSSFEGILLSISDYTVELGRFGCKHMTDEERPSVFINNQHIIAMTYIPGEADHD
jgi:hypothetical protein